jgi:hypothetical protein
LSARQQGSGAPWLSVQSVAAVALTQPIRAGYGVKRSLIAVSRKDASRWSRGDVLRVRLEIDDFDLPPLLTELHREPAA